MFKHLTAHPNISLNKKLKAISTISVTLQQCFMVATKYSYSI